MALPNIEGFLSVITAFNPNSPWIESSRDMVSIIQASAAVGIPTINDLSKLVSIFLRKEDMSTTLDGLFMRPPTPSVLNSLVQGGVGVSNTSHLRFEIFGEDNVETLVTDSGKVSEVSFSDEIGGPTLAARISSNAHGHVMLPAQTQHNSDSGDIFSKE